MSENKHWLILYDIRDAKRLNKVEKCVSSYAWRVQKSVFESNAPESTILQLKTELNRLIETEDFVLFFNICERDWQKQEVYGVIGKNTEQTDKFLII